MQQDTVQGRAVSFLNRSVLSSGRQVQGGCPQDYSSILVCHFTTSDAQCTWPWWNSFAPACVSPPHDNEDIGPRGLQKLGCSVLQGHAGEM